MTLRGQALGSMYTAASSRHNQVQQYLIMENSLQSRVHDPRVGLWLVVTSRTISRSIWTCFICIFQSHHFPWAGWSRSSACCQEWKVKNLFPAPAEALGPLLKPLTKSKPITGEWSRDLPGIPTLQEGQYACQAWPGPTTTSFWGHWSTPISYTPKEAQAIVARVTHWAGCSTLGLGVVVT